MAYQSFDGKTGHSRSAEKLSKLRLPPLAGLRVLDIGCNEGFFCAEALKQGASRVVGIELNPSYAAIAQENCPGATILNQSWDWLPNEKFDIILMLSAIHYEKRQRDLMKRIYDRLSPNGMFIFEGGILMEEGSYWKEIKRSTGSHYFPTYELLRDHIFEDFASRLIGTSVPQSGDPLPRYVVHCTRRAPSILVIPGVSRTGKTVLAHQFGILGSTSISTDLLLLEQKRSRYQTSDAAFNEYLSTIDSETISKWVNGVTDPALARRIASFLYNTAPKEDNLIIMEGYVFSNQLIVKAFFDLCSEGGTRGWTIERKA